MALPDGLRSARTVIQHPSRHPVYAHICTQVGCPWYGCMLYGMLHRYRLHVVGTLLYGYGIAWVVSYLVCLHTSGTSYLLRHERTATLQRTYIVPYLSTLGYYRWMLLVECWYGGIPHTSQDR